MLIEMLLNYRPQKSTTLNVSRTAADNVDDDISNDDVGDVLVVHDVIVRRRVSQCR